MATKKVKIGTKPNNSEVEEWVATRSKQQPPEPAPEKMRRLTLDISESLHRAIKMKSVEEGVPMANLLRDLLQEHFVN
ncbi:MAG: hypothetical protein F6K24_13230 [Okeania sp. SIO2D1]|nr:hypothetical protein [Okeania sp. SIO2D1]